MTSQHTAELGWEQGWSRLLRLVETEAPPGEEADDDGARFLGHLPQVAPEAWFHRLYAGCSAQEVTAVEKALGMPLTAEHRWLLQRCNGMELFNEALVLYGVPRRSSAMAGYEMVTPNRYERLPVPQGWLLVGVFAYDQAQLYCDGESGLTYLCPAGRGDPVHHWASLLAMLLSETARLAGEFDDEGDPRDAVSGHSLASREVAPPVAGPDEDDERFWRRAEAAHRYRRWLEDRPTDVSVGAGGIELYDTSERARATAAARAAGWGERWVVLGIDSALGDPIVIAADMSAPICSLLLTPEGVEATQIADSLDGFAAALAALQDAATDRGNPVELEANPPGDGDVERLARAVSDANPHAEAWWWTSKLRPQAEDDAVM